MAANVNSHC